MTAIWFEYYIWSGKTLEKVFYGFYQQQKISDCENEAKCICHLSHFEKRNNQPFSEKGNKKFITNVKYRF